MSHPIDANPARRGEEPDFDDASGFSESVAGVAPRRNVVIDDAFDNDRDGFRRQSRARSEPGGFDSSGSIDDDDIDEPFRSDPPYERSSHASAPPDYRRERANASPSTSASPNVGEAYGSVWRWAIFASAVWLASAGAFLSGAYGVSIGGGFFSGVAALGDKALAVFLALALGPLSLIWMAAIVARQAKALRIETNFLQDFADRLSEELAERPIKGGEPNLAFTSGQDAAALKREAEATIASLQKMEESFIAAEQRARDARERMEGENVALRQLMERQRSGDGRPDQSGNAAEFAAMVANALASSAVMRDLAATRPSTPASVRPVSVESSPEIAQGFDDARAAVMRAADAAVASIEDGRGEDADKGHAAETPRAGLMAGADDDDAPGQIEELRRQLSETKSAPPPERRISQNAPQDAEVGETQEAHSPSSYAGPTLVHDADAANGGGLDWAKFVRAANFPDSEDDRETLDALYAVLTDRDAAGLLQSAEDALSGLADIGLFMEDMRPHHAPVDVWRRYVVDNDQRDAMELGGVRDPHAIEDVIAALNEKPDFAMTTDRFLKRYEEVLSRLFSENQDSELVVKLADTRSGRAYMLLGRSAGRFG